MERLDHSTRHPYFSGEAENKGRVFQQYSGLQINADSLVLSNSAHTIGEHHVAVPFAALQVSDVSAIELGVHHADSGAEGDLPPYVKRQIDDELRRRISRIANTGEVVLIVGDSTAGKTRAAFEALTECYAGDRVFSPFDGPDLVTALPSLLETERTCVLWLDNLERYIGPDGLTPPVLGLLRRSRVPVISTMRAEQYRRFVPSPTQFTSSREDERTDLGRRILEQISPLVLPRLWNHEEIQRARQVEDTRIAGAVAFSTHYGIAEYLAAGPRLYQEWILSWGPGANPRGAALVAAAVDCVRAGVTNSVTRDLLERMHEKYLARVGGAMLRPETIEEAFEWATCLRFGVTSLLMPAERSGRFRVFDYIADEFMRSNASQEIPHSSWREVLSFAKEENSTYLVGLAASRHGATEIAEEAWRESAHRGSGKALVRLGNLYLSTERETEAVEAWEKAAEAGEISAYSRLGAWHQERGDVEKAIDLFRKGAASDDVWSIYKLAEALEAAEEGERWWIRLLELEGTSEARHNLGYFYFVSGREKLALENYQKAAEEGNVPSMNNYGTMLAENSPGEAEKWFRRAYQEGSPQAAANLAKIHNERGQADEAERLLEEAIEKGYVQATVRLGWLHKEQGRKEKAKEVWSKGAEAGVDRSIYNLAMLYEDEGETDRAVQLYRQIADNSDEAAENLAFLLVKSGNFAEAERNLSRIKESVDPQSCCALGSVYYDKGERELAEAWYVAALESGHGHAGCWLGGMASQDGRFEDAARFYRASFNSGHTHAAARMSDMLIDLGQGKEAAHWLRLSRGYSPVRSKRSVPSRKRRGKKK
ncbi:tetratricopeptide repeat protein [Streptomyces sp. SLBN-134]|uniref:tetratricopeptide repeat protein n=1 Tax=Streptomyces sp. SLBN-134 TaxID=2768456 RepID=UPI001153D294|nr:tetratricopeptide repeat protein [Streptomyces sp. SLBN-134]TQL21169.1 hypothetical protein FBY37_3146 [Streptomyces sp. SLBN-134]